MTGKQKKLLVRIITATVLFAVIFLLEHLTELNKYIFLCLYLVPYFTVGLDVLYKSARNIIHGKVFDECFLMTVATVGALIIGEYPESVFVMLFYQIGELFQSIAVGKSRRSIAALMDIRPETANVIRQGVEEEVFPEEVATGEELIIRPGERVPIDSVIIQGNSSLNTSALTGEALPQDVGEGDKIISGCINLTGVLHVRTLCDFNDSAVSKILELVENSSMNKSKSENFITKFAAVYTPAVVVFAALLTLIPSLITGNWSEWVYRALIFLVVSCPCALVISIPMTFFCGIGGASAKGILIKGANYLERMGNISAVVFDKTGTLTRGEFRVSEIHPANGFTQDELLSLTACAETYSSHPIALGIKEKCPGEAIPENVSELTGLGVKAEVNSKQVLSGSAALMEKENIAFTPCTGETAVYTAVDGVFAGAIVLSDTLKDNSKAAISRLKKMGIKNVSMLTGDTRAAAQRAADELGLTGFSHSLLPVDKVEKIAELCKLRGEKETVVFVGDGINDAPVLTRADVGIAMGALGSDAAIEAADMVIMDDDPMKIVTVMEIAAKTRRIVRENVALALSIKLGVLLLAAFGLTSMWIGVLADVGVAIAAIANANRSRGG